MRTALVTNIYGEARIQDSNQKLRPRQKWNLLGKNFPRIKSTEISLLGATVQ